MPKRRLLGPPDSEHFKAAIAWLEKDRPEMAEEQLARITPQFQNHPDVLELRWNAQGMREAWGEALSTAQQLIKKAPERPESWLARALALHELGRTPEARESLVPALARFPGHSLVLYNMACFASAMQQHTIAPAGAPAVLPLIQFAPRTEAPGLERT